MAKVRITDAGKTAAGMGWEKNDCAVRALSEAK